MATPEDDVRPSERGIRVRTLAASGFLFEPLTTRRFLEAPWQHLYAWLRYEEPLPRELAALLYHLDAFTRDSFAPQAIGKRLSRTELEPLLRQVAEFLANEVYRQLSHNRGIEALLRRDYERGFAHLEAPRELARLLGLAQVVERYLAWPDAEAAPELVTHLEAVLARAESAEFDRHPQRSAQIVARVLAVLVPLLGGVHQQVLVPLAGATPGVVQLTVAATLPAAATTGEAQQPSGGGGTGKEAASASPAAAGSVAAAVEPSQTHSQPHTQPQPTAASSSSGRRRVVVGDGTEVHWLGLPVSSEVRDGALTLLRALATLVPDAAAAATTATATAATTAGPSRIHLFVSETAHRPLERTVRLMSGRSWELGALLALLATRLGTRLTRTAVTGQLDVRSGTVEAVGGIEEKVEALYACRHPEHGPLARRLICPASNVAAAERTARRLGWHDLSVHGVTHLAQLPALAGLDPWRRYCEWLIAGAQQQWSSLGLPESLRETWRRTLREHLRTTSSTYEEGRVLVVPCPFGVEPQAWARQLAALYATQRLEAAAAEPRPDEPSTETLPAVPVILPVETGALGITELIAAGLVPYRAATPSGNNNNNNNGGDETGHDERHRERGESDILNQYQRPEGFVFLHADPSGASPLLDPPHQPLNLTRRHPALRHRFCFVAADMHQLEAWRRHPLFARL